jgi:hypothetical protein
LHEIPTNTYLLYCHYPAVFLQKYLHILRQFLRRFPRRFLRGCIAVCAVASPSHRRRIAVASPHSIAAASHRRSIASLHKTQATCRLH